MGERASATAAGPPQPSSPRCARRSATARWSLAGHGYSLTVAPGELDADAFDALVRASARGARRRRCRAARRRLLRRGAAPICAAPRWASWPTRSPAAARRSRRSGSTAIEDRIDADLALSRHAALATEFAELIERHPQRERLRGQQMLALYRATARPRRSPPTRTIGAGSPASSGSYQRRPCASWSKPILEHDPGARRRQRRARRRPPGAGRPVAAAAAVSALAAPSCSRDGLAGPRSPRTRCGRRRCDRGDRPGEQPVTASYPVGRRRVLSVSVGGGAAWAVAPTRRRSRASTCATTPRAPSGPARSRWSWPRPPTRSGSSPPTPTTPVAQCPGRACASSRSTSYTGGRAFLQITLDCHRDGLAYGSPVVACSPLRRGGARRSAARRLLRLDRVSGPRGPPRGSRAIFVAAGRVRSGRSLATRTSASRTSSGSTPAAAVCSNASSSRGHRSRSRRRAEVMGHRPYTGSCGGSTPARRAAADDPGRSRRRQRRRRPTLRLWAANSVTAPSAASIRPPTASIATAALGGTPRAVALGAGRAWVAVAGGERARRARSRPAAAHPPLTAAGCGPALTAGARRPADRGRPPTQGRFTSTDLPVPRRSPTCCAPRLPRRPLPRRAAESATTRSRIPAVRTRASAWPTPRAYAAQPGRDRRRRADQLVLRRGDAADPQPRARRAGLRASPTNSRVSLTRPIRRRPGRAPATAVSDGSPRLRARHARRRRRDGRDGGRGQAARARPACSTSTTSRTSPGVCTSAPPRAGWTCGSPARRRWDPRRRQLPRARAARVAPPVRRP